MNDSFAPLEKVLQHCEQQGAQAAVKIRHQDEWSTDISDGSIERKEAATNQAMSINCHLSDGRNASVSTNDLRPQLVLELADEAIALAKAGAADEWEGLADSSDCGAADVAGLDDGGTDFDDEQAIALILDAERIARSQDQRIIATHRSGVSMTRGKTLFAASNGIRQLRVGSSYRGQLVVVAEDNGEKQMGYSWTSSRSFKQLRDAEALASEAVTKAVEAYNWKQAPTGTVNVVFNNEIASQIVGLAARLAAGSAVYRGSTCWGDQLAQQVAGEQVQLIDDPLIDGGLGSRIADSDGVKSRRTQLIKDGVLQCFLTSVYSARRLQQPLTAHGGGSSNLLLQAGSLTEDELLAQLGTGFYVTGLQGHGVDLSSGHWSKGASGFWIEDGKRSYPVQNVTLAGNLKEMFRNISGIADNPLQESSTSAPAILVTDMQLGGSDSN